MIAQIQFIKGITENTLPIVKLTKSKNGKNGTGTFIFLSPDIFSFESIYNRPIHGMYLIWDNKEIVGKDIQILFKEGKPFLLKVIYIFKNSNEWFHFLNFMNAYSKETGLLFSEKISLS